MRMPRNYASGVPGAGASRGARDNAVAAKGPRWYLARPFCPALAWVAASPRERVMSKVCQVTGKKPLVGNTVSHANNKRRRRFEPNLHTHRFWVEAEKKFIKLRVSHHGLRIIDKKGVEAVLAEIRARGEKV